MFRRLLLGLIDLYRKGISPFFPASCRFDPSCSAYARESVERFGVVRGGWLFFKRFARCHPFGGFGYDPVPTSSVGPPPAAPSDGRGDEPNTSTMDLRAR